MNHIHSFKFILVFIINHFAQSTFECVLRSQLLRLEYFDSNIITNIIDDIINRPVALTPRL